MTTLVDVKDYLKETLYLKVTETEHKGYIKVSLYLGSEEISYDFIDLPEKD